jgi:hypothetical protein
VPPLLKRESALTPRPSDSFEQLRTGKIPEARQLGGKLARGMVSAPKRTFVLRRHPREQVDVRARKLFDEESRRPAADPA